MQLRHNEYKVELQKSEYNVYTQTNDNSYIIVRSPNLRIVSDYVSYKLGRQYKIMLDATDEEETEYKDYEVSIQGDQFISNIY